MNIERALRVPLVDGGLVKVIIGAVLNLIPIVNFLSCGYLLELTGNATHDRHEMPAWENWGEKFVKGFFVFIITLIYMLIPLIIVWACGGWGTCFQRELPAYFPADSRLLLLRR